MSGVSWCYTLINLPTFQRMTSDTAALWFLARHDEYLFISEVVNNESEYIYYSCMRSLIHKYLSFVTNIQ